MRAECVIDGVAESPTRADVSPVDEHGPQRNCRRNVFLPRLAYTVQETAHVLGGICPKTVRLSDREKAPASFSRITLSSDPDLGDRSIPRDDERALRQRTRETHAVVLCVSTYSS